MSLEQKINYHLNKYPFIKKGIKRCYQLTMYAFSPKIKCKGHVIRVSPDDPSNEYFFGYYDKSPWDASGRYMLCLRTKCTWKEVAPNDTADIVLIDLEHKDQAPILLATTHTWNVQQGCMLQWLGPDFSDNIIYNDLRNNKYCSVILNISTHKERVLPMPIYAISHDGQDALSLDFSRLHRLRPGYGYSNLPDLTEKMSIPNDYCIYKIHIPTENITPLLKYNDFAYFEPRKEMNGAIHKVNHLMISPDGKRFMILHRWFNGQHKYTRLLTCNMDGTQLFNLSDCDMVSHCYWKNNQEIIAFEHKPEGTGYYLMKDLTQEYQRLWPNISEDGHPSYSPNGRWIITDTYPNRSRIAQINLLSDTKDNKITLAKVFAPFKYDNDTRCDLHPRWDRDSKTICFDSVFEGHRGVYIVHLPQNL